MLAALDVGYRWGQKTDQQSRNKVIASELHLREDLNSARMDAKFDHMSDDELLEFLKSQRAESSKPRES